MVLVSVPVCLVTLLFVVIHQSTAQTKTKRQIYREQVLPHSGGKIPEEAFRADRLALNRLNKEGIAVPDGILLEHRHVHSHPHNVKHDPEDEADIIRIIQQTENRYTPEVGRYHNEAPLTVASTYLIRKPIGREETNIRTPDQQRPLHQAIKHKQESGHQQRPQYNHPLPTGYQHQQQYFPHPPPPPPLPHRFQTHVHNSQYHAYHPIPVPFELPNKEIQQEEYYIKQFDSGYPTGDDINSRIEWPLLLGNLEKLHGDLNSLGPSAYEYQTQYFEPEGITHYSSYRNFFDSFNGRFARKSQEGYAKGSKTTPKDGTPTTSTRRTENKRTLQNKCRNTEGSKCQVY